MLSLMRLDRFWIEEMVIETAPEDNSKAQQHTYDIKNIDFDVKKNRQSNALRVRLLVEIVAVESPRIYGLTRVRVILWGQFSFAENAEEDFIQQVTPQNQLSILYGLARGVVANVTGATATGTFLLPGVDFHAVTAEKVQRLQQASGLVPAETPSTAPSKTRKRKQLQKVEVTNNGG